MRKSSLSNIDWRENDQGQLVAFENGLSLETALDKVEFQLKPGQNHIVIIGIGSGFAIHQIFEKYPSVPITVIECRDSLVGSKRKLYPKINFVVVQSIEELMQCDDYQIYLRPETAKYFLKKSAGAQASFFQEIFWNLNLRTTEALKQVVQLDKPIDDRWLINAKQLMESTGLDNLPYRNSEILIIQELIK